MRSDINHLPSLRCDGGRGRMGGAFVCARCSVEPPLSLHMNSWRMCSPCLWFASGPVVVRTCLEYLVCERVLGVVSGMVLLLCP